MSAFRGCLILALVLISGAANCSAEKLRGRLDPKVEVGKEIRLSIGTHKKARKFEIEKGPETISISYEKGIFVWTPEESELGPQTVTVIFRVVGKRRRITMNTVVVASSTMKEKTPATNPPAKTGNKSAANPKTPPQKPSVQPIDDQTVSLAPYGRIKRFKGASWALQSDNPPLFTLRDIPEGYTLQCSLRRILKPKNVAC